MLEPGNGENAKMSEEEILREFDRLGLSNRHSDIYPGANNFALQYRRCTILKDTSTTYSSSSSILIK